MHDELATTRAEWRSVGAKIALESGLSATAIVLYSSLFEESPELPEGAAQEYRLDLVAALVGQGRFSEARKALDLVFPSRFPSRYNLYSAVVGYGSGTYQEAALLEAALSGIDQGSLRPVDLPWLYLLRGVLSDLQGQSGLAGEQFSRAVDSAASALQEAFFLSLVFRQKLLTAPADEELLLEVRRNLDALSGQSGAFPFLREYAVILYRMGRDVEAVLALEDELAKVGTSFTSDERSELLLLKGLILGTNSDPGWSALKELVRIGAESKSSAIALQLLTRASGRDAELMSFLNEMISQPDSHPLLAMMYFIRCQLALANPETAAIAEADARFLLEQFPGLDEITSVYRLLAYAALQRSPPQYRVAADYLISLREQVSGASELAELNRMIGDCYFMNKDYGNAVDFYQAARTSSSDSNVGVSTFLRLVIAEIRSGMIDAALAHLDEADFGGSMDVADRWRAEWNIAQALQSDGNSSLALDRIRSLLSSQDTGPVPAALDMRLRWLEAHLSLFSGAEGVQTRVGSIIARLDSLPPDALGASEAFLLKAELLLLEAQASLRSSEASNGFEAIRQLRDSFPTSTAAERSYFVEASYHAGLGDFLSAQQILAEYISEYPDSTLAPQALFQASLHCERRGPDNYPEAVLLLDQIVQDYSDSALVYQASLRQGDLLRLMNDFAGAQLIYENLVNAYPSHELQYLAELSRADCIAALSQGDATQLLEATSVLERLVDMPGLPADFQVEAGHKWGMMLRRQGKADDAREIFSLIATRYMLDAQNALGLGSVGRYWLSRTAFSLGDMLENVGEIEEAKRLYRKMVAFNLPGRNLALTRVEQLQISESR
ncbi:MAG: tetratricopeptide repeat protein [Verrucomicrobiota bacterium]